MRTAAEIKQLHDEVVDQWKQTVDEIDKRKAELAPFRKLATELAEQRNQLAMEYATALDREAKGMLSADELTQHDPGAMDMMMKGKS